MRRLRTFVAVATAGAVSLFGLAGTAQADTADDVAIILENLPGAADELVAGLQEALDVLTATQSAEETSHAAGDAVVAFGSALVAGTEQFGLLGFGFGLLENNVQVALAPYLQAIDDPSTAADVVDPADVATLLGNLGPALDAFLYGDAGFPGPPDTDNGARAGLIHLLEGNLIGDGVLGVLAPSAIGGLVLGTAAGLQVLTAGTNYDTLVPLVGVAVLVGGGAAGSYVQQLEDALAPLFEALTPVTEPLIGVLEGL